MIATTGASLLPSEALHKLRTRLLPRATILTPNVPEAYCLLAADPSLNHDDDTVPMAPIEKADDLETVARAVRRLGPKWVLVKGGHCPFRADGTVARTEAERELVVDVLVGGEGDEEVVVRVETGYCRSRHTHGTGCSLACEFFLLIFILFLQIFLSRSKM